MGTALRAADSARAHLERIAAVNHFESPSDGRWRQRLFCQRGAIGQPIRSQVQRSVCGARVLAQAVARTCSSAHCELGGDGQCLRQSLQPEAPLVRLAPTAQQLLCGRVASKAYARTRRTCKCVALLGCVAVCTCLFLALCDRAVSTHALRNTDASTHSKAVELWPRPAAERSYIAPDELSHWQRCK